MSGPATDNASCSSFATVSGLGGNGWLFQVTTRPPGQVDAAQTAYASGAELAGAMRRAPAAGGARWNRIGAADLDWPGWCGAYLPADKAGTEVPR